MSEVRNIKDGLVNKVVEDFTDYAIHTHYYFSNGVDLIVCRELYPYCYLFLRTNKTYNFCIEEDLPDFIRKEISLKHYKNTKNSFNHREYYERLF